MDIFPSVPVPVVREQDRTIHLTNMFIMSVLKEKLNEWHIHCKRFTYKYSHFMYTLRRLSLYLHITSGIYLYSISFRNGKTIEINILCYGYMYIK